MNRGPDDSSTEIANQIGAICVRFRANWTNRPQPTIQEYLAEVEAPLKATLLKALLHLDVELLRRAGSAVPLEEYRKRFPEFLVIVAALDFPKEAASQTCSLSLNTDIDGVATRFDDSDSAAPSDLTGDKRLRAHTRDVPSELPLPLLHPRYQILRCIARGGIGGRLPGAGR